ncbi:protein RoBo-1-like [Nannospalax galili]|uniref:protein RoBo-1-like n=1 Tax=Nannospalax galili TaxID=1026970 RepID=UPI0004ED104E|nr:protein RoBo-1-like [Nannospalax galili]
MSWPSILKRLLAVCVFTVFSASTVESFTCVNSMCANGIWITTPGVCETSQGCFNLVQEFKDPVSSVSLTIQQKGCLTAACTHLTFSATLDSQRTIRSDQRCCQAEQCNKQDLQLSQPSSQINGVQCPACYIENAATCDSVPLKCTGAETKCIEFSGKDSEMPTLSFYGKGCATETACNLNMNMFGNMKIQTSCTDGTPPSTSISTATTGSPPLTLISSVLTILLKVLL